MKKLDISEKVVNRSYLSIGSNLGDKKLNIEKAKFLIISEGIYIFKCSSYYETPSWPNSKHPKFLNVVIQISSNFKLFDLFRILKKIEKKIGRKKNPKNYPRVCDIDIVDFNKLYMTKTLGCNSVIVPHPRMYSRNFVLMPLFEIEPAWIDPKSNKEISEIISNLSLNSISAIKII